jgi:hypothetical protein
MIEVFDKFVPEDYQNQVAIFSDAGIPFWGITQSDFINKQNDIYNDYVKDKSGVQDTIGNCNVLFNVVYESAREKNNTELMEKFGTLIFFAQDKSDSFTIKQYSTIVAEMLTPNIDDEEQILAPVYDATTPGSKTLIYFMDDSDSDIVLYKQSYDDVMNDEPLEIDRVITAKKGRALLFPSETVYARKIPNLSNKGSIIKFVCKQLTKQDLEMRQMGKEELDSVGEVLE